MSIICRLVCSVVLLVCSIRTAYAEVDMSIIAHIESHHNPSAYNKRSHARGEHQITPIVLREYNVQTHSQYQQRDLFDENVNAQIAEWYMNVRIPELLVFLHIADTTENRLIAYNAGVGVLKKYVSGKRALKYETREYIKKYHTLTGG